MVRSMVMRMSAALAVALGAGAVLVTTGPPATATQGDPVLAGLINTETNPTVINNTTAGATCTISNPGNGLGACGVTGVQAIGSVLGLTAFGGSGVQAYATSSTGIGVFGRGHEGVHGESLSKNGIGVSGSNTVVVGTNYGVYGSAASGYGVWGQGSVSGVYGTGSADSGTGVHGTATGFHAYGVYGEANGASGTGVYGITTASTGAVSGVEGYSLNSSSGYGVFGSALGTGVKGTTSSATGIGVHAANTSTGLALLASGRVSFSTAGIAVVPSGAKKVTVALPGITTSDFVLATVQGNTAFSVKGALAGTGQLTIWLNKSSTGDVTVAYFVLSGS